MSDVLLIPDPSDKEVDWTLDPSGGQPPQLRGDAVETTAASPMQEVKRHFGLNVAATIGARVVNMARGVCLVPFLLWHIGLEAYGIWTTIFILVSYVGVTTLGLSNVYIKYVAEFHARREYDKANALLSTGLSITIPLCATLFAGFVLCWKWYSPWLRLPPAHAADGKEAVLIVLGIFLSSIAFNGFGDLLTGTQQIAPTQIFLIISILIEFGLILWLVSAGRGIRGLAEAYLARTIINDGLTIWWAFRKLKWLRVSPWLVSRAAIKQVVRFGGVVQLQSMLAMFLSSVERLTGLFTVGVKAAGLLDVAKKWPSALSTVPMAFFFALLPAASHVEAASSPTDRLRNLRKLYLSTSRYSNLSTVVFVAAIVFWARPIMHIWLGPELPKLQSAVTLFVVFSLAMQFHMLTGPGNSLFRGMGRIYEEFNYAVPNVVLLAVTLPTAHWIQGRWTPLGIGLAAASATIVSACVLMGRVLFVLDLKLTSYFKEVIVPGLAAYMIAALLAWPVARLVAETNRWEGAGVLFMAGTIYVGGTVLILHRWVLTSEEKRKGAELYTRSLEVFRRREAVA